MINYKEANLIIGNIANKVAKCNESKLHVLVEAFQIVRFIWISINLIIEGGNTDKQRIHLLKLINDLQDLYLAIRKRISHIHGLSNHYCYVL